MDEVTQARRRKRAEWIADQIRQKSTHAAVVMSGMRESLTALADFVIDCEDRLQTLERKK